MISIFISSTFKDMQAERDILHTIVFPKIRTRLEPYGESLQELDLRWGVDTSLLSEEESSKAVIDTCIDGINRCRPYMLVLLGNRYGWIPDETAFGQVNDNRIKNYSNENMSITQMEIEYGALESSDLNKCIFCFRNQDLPSAMPALVKANYDSESALHREKLESLKQKIMAREGAQIMKYDAAWNDEIGVELTDFADRITDAIWEMIKRDLPEIDVNADDMPERGVFADVVARRRQYMQTYICRKEDRDPRLSSGWYVGRPGTGKSAMLARVATNFIKIGVTPFLYFCENRNCNNTNMLLSAMLCYLDKIEGKPEKSYFAESKLEKLNQIVNRIRETKEEFVLIIDAADKMDAYALDTILVIYRAVEKLDKKERFASIIVSSTDDYFEENKNQITSTTPVTEISYFNQLEINSFVDRHTALRAKTLDEAVLTSIREKSESRVPYYLSLMLQRLLMMDQDDFEKAEEIAEGMAGISDYMCNLVKSMPDETDKLVLSLLDETYSKMSRHSRTLENAVGGFKLATPADIMNLLAASVNGLKLSDISKIMESRGLFVLPALMEQIFTYLYDSFEQTGDGVWNFRHRLMRESIRRAMPEGIYTDLCNALLEYFAGSEAANPNEILSYAFASGKTAAAAELIKDKDVLDGVVNCLRTEDGRAFLRNIFKTTDQLGRTRILTFYVLSENIPLTDKAIGAEYLTSLCEASDDLSTDGKYLLELMRKKFAYFDMNKVELERSQTAANELHESVSAEIRDIPDVAEIFEMKEATANDYPELSDESHVTNDMRALMGLAESSLCFIDILKDEPAVEQAEKQIESLEQLNGSYPTNRGTYLLAKLYLAIVERTESKDKRDARGKKARKYIDSLIADLSPENVTVEMEDIRLKLCVVKAKDCLEHIGRWQKEHIEADTAVFEEAAAFAEASLKKNYRISDALNRRDIYHSATKYFYYLNSEADFEKWIALDLNTEQTVENNLTGAENLMSFIEHRVELAEMLCVREYTKAFRDNTYASYDLWKKLLDDPDRSKLDKADLGRLDVRIDVLYGLIRMRDKEYDQAISLYSDAFSKLNSLIKEQGGMYPKDKLLAGYVLVKLANAQRQAGKSELGILEYLKEQFEDSVKYCGYGKDYRAGMRLVASGLVRLAEIYKDNENEKSAETYKMAQDIYIKLASYMPEGNVSNETLLRTGFRNCIVSGINKGLKIDPAMYDLYIKALFTKSQSKELDKTETIIFKRGLPLSTDALLWRNAAFLDKAEQIVADDDTLRTAVKFARAIKHLAEYKCKLVLEEMDDILETRPGKYGEEWVKQVMLLVMGDKEYNHELAMAGFRLWSQPVARMMTKLPAPVFDMANMYFKGYYAIRLANSGTKYIYAKEYLGLLKKVVEQEKEIITNSSEDSYSSAQSKMQLVAFLGIDIVDNIDSYGGLKNSWYSNSDFWFFNFQVAAQLIGVFFDKESGLSKEEYLKLIDEFSEASWYFIDPKQEFSSTGTLVKAAFQLEAHRALGWYKDAGDVERGAAIFSSILSRYIERIDPKDNDMHNTLYEMCMYLIDCIFEDKIKDEMFYLKQAPGYLSKVCINGYKIKHNVAWIEDYIKWSNRIRDRIKTKDDQGSAVLDLCFTDREVIMPYLETEKNMDIVEKYLNIIEDLIKGGYINGLVGDISAITSDLYKIMADYPELLKPVSELITQLTSLHGGVDDLISYIMTQGVKHNVDAVTENFNVEEWYLKRRKELDELYGHLV